MRFRFNNIYLVVFLLSFPGYALLAGTANLVGLPGATSSTASMIMRVLNVGLASLLILGGIGRTRDDLSNQLILALTVFWFAYLVRMFIDTIYDPLTLWQDPSYYWMWAVGGCFIPMLGLALRPKQLDEMDTLFKWFYLTTFLACGIALATASGIRVDDKTGLVERLGRARIGDDRLNPISLGHLGATLALQSMWALVFFRNWSTLTKRLLLIAGLCIGLYIMMIANSRGPVVAALACVAITVLFAPTRYRVVLLVLLGISIASAIPLAYYIEETFGIVTFTRLFGTTIMEHVAHSTRFLLYERALVGFLDNPLFGSWLEIPGAGYPHNFVIEAFMATGLAIGTLLLVSLLLLVKKAVSILSNHAQAGWISLLFFQHVIGQQFSGALYNSTYVWASIGLILSLRMRSGNKNSDPEQLTVQTMAASTSTFGAKRIR